MKIFVGRQKTSFGVMAAAVFMLIFTAVLLLSSFAFAEDAQVKTHEGETLLTIHENGSKKVIVADGGTIGDAIKKAGIEINENDNVEPSLDQELIASEYKVNIYRTRPVVVIDGFNKRQITTALQTPQQIVDEADIVVRDEDNLSLEKADLFRDGAGLKVVIDRAQAIKVILFGKETTMYTHAGTVQEFLDEKEISLGENDRVSLGLNSSINTSEVLKIWREGKQTITVEEEVEFSVKNEYDADRPVGYSSVKQEGVVGSKLVTYDVVIVDGEINERLVLSEIITTQPVERIVILGAKSNVSYSADKEQLMAAAGIKQSDFPYVVEILNRENRSWCPTLWQGKSSGGCPATFIAHYSENAAVGYGLCQATPGSKMASAGADWRTNPVTQLKWCHSYAVGRYGSWQNAASFSRCIGSCYSSYTNSTINKATRWW
jgi:uncharacterized protein YabE (DUF348 family)